MSDLTNVLQPEHPILPQLTQRRSPRAYTNQPVSAETLQQLFTAAGSAASCLGEQPWRYLVGSKSSSPEAYEKILAALAEFNKPWAGNAPVLAVSVAKQTFSADGNLNPFARHDVGQATATMAIQAVELGVQLHQMGGFSADALREAFHIPADFEPVAVFTIGYPGDIEKLSDYNKTRELAPRLRKPLGEIMFEGSWPSPQTEPYGEARV